MNENEKGRETEKKSTETTEKKLEPQDVADDVKKILMFVVNKEGFIFLI